MQCCSYLEIEALQLGELLKTALGWRRTCLVWNTWPKFAFSIVLIWSAQHFGCPVLLLLMTKYTWPHDQSFFFKRWYTWLMALWQVIKSHLRQILDESRINFFMTSHVFCFVFVVSICGGSLWRRPPAWPEARGLLHDFMAPKGEKAFNSWAADCDAR